MAEVTIRNGDASTPPDGVHKAIVRLGEETMVHPDIMTGEYRYGGAIRLLPMSHMIRAAANGGRARRHNVVHVNAVHDDILHELNLEPSPTGEMNVGAPAINGLVRGQNELVLELDLHVAVENDPQRLGLQDAVAESALLGVHHVVVAVVCHHVHVAGFPPGSVFPESDGAIGQRLPVRVPVGVRAPAIVHGVPVGRGQNPPRAVPLPCNVTTQDETQGGTQDRQDRRCNTSSGLEITD